MMSDARPPRSSSTPGAGFTGAYNMQSHRVYTQSLDGSAPVHLLTSDLWEAMTGEKLSPTNICQIFNISMPAAESQAPKSPQMLQALQFVMMSKDRAGSRNMQYKLEEGNPNEVTAIFEALYPHLSTLVYDQAANFVIQKMCEVINPVQQSRMLRFFLSNIKTVIDHPNGCRVLQKFIESTSKENILTIFEAVKGNLLDLCLSQNGNHIVQRFIESLPEKIGDMIAVTKPNLVRLAVDNCGCRVVQRLFDKYKVNDLGPLVTEVLKNAAELATNQYGNYVVQHILEARRREDVSALVAAFKGHFYEFSIHKFASNVIEKCIRGATEEERIVIFTEIIGEEGMWEDERIAVMVGDQFGNYVMQRIIEYGTEAQQDAIYDVVYDEFDNLYGINYAKHVIARLEELEYEF